MAARKLAVIFVALFSASAAAAREMPPASPQSLLEARLWASSQAESDGGSGMADCWGALIELRSCTNEVVLFFLNGEAYIGQDCCRAIRIITHQCWPNMLSSIGFTAEEGDILRDYCSAEAAALKSPVAAVPAPTPAPAPAPLSFSPL